MLPGHALAQTDASSSVRDRPREEYDAAGRNLGGFMLNAAVDFGVGTTDNLFATELNEQSDVIYAVEPSARLTSNWSRHALVAEAGARFESHGDFSNEDVNTGYGRVTGRLDVGSNSSLSATAGMQHAREPRTDPDSPIGGDPVEYDHNDVSVTASHRFNRLRVSGTLGRNEFNYDGGQSFRDNERTSVAGRLDAELTPRLGIVVQAIADERDYDSLPGLNSEGREFLGGVTIDFTDLMRGEITAGTFDRDYDSGASINGTAIAANLEWYITGLTTLTFNARQDAEDVGGTVAQPYTEREFGARVDHELQRNVILMGAIGNGQRDYEAIAREDDFMRAEAGVDYLMNRRVAIRGRYIYDDVESSGANRYRDFEVNQFTVELSLRL